MLAQQFSMLRFHRLQFVFAIMITIPLAVPPSPVAATYPPGDPPETVPFGTQGEIPDYELTVVNVEMNAEALLNAFDPSLGYVSDTAYVMVQVEAHYTGEFTGNPAKDFIFTLTGSKGDVYDDSVHACDVWPVPPESISIEPRETARFNLCFFMPLWLVLDGDMELVAHTNLRRDHWPVTFALDESDGAHDDNDAIPPCGCTPPAYDSERT
jgi:hypothetical protein